MDSIDCKLTGDERIIYRTRCHWAMFLGPALVIIIGGLAFQSQGVHAMVLMAFGLVWGAFSYSSMNGSEIGLTQKRLLINGGFPRLRYYDVSLDKISAIDFYQPSLGSLMDFGRITIVYGGGTRCSIRFVSSPAKLVAEVRQEMASLSTSSSQQV